MISLLSEIETIGKASTSTKQESILRGIINLIETHHFKMGDILPSVNELSKNLGYARETVVKAYNELKQRGIIESKQGVGFFISNENTELQLSIALVLYGFQTFQQDFYNTFRKSLGKKYQIDVFFHHNNLPVYETIIDSIQGRYGMYVVAPIQIKKAKHLLDNFNPERLLIIDRYLYINDKVSKVTQEFEQSLLRVFEELTNRIKKYNKVLLYYRSDSDYPKGIYDATMHYAADQNIEVDVYEQFEEEHLQKGNLFFTIGDSDLWSILKAGKNNGMLIGKDYGVLSHNDSPVKEIIQGGITTFSTDFNQMAKHAATFIKNKKVINKIVPSKLIIRKSL